MFDCTRGQGKVGYRLGVGLGLALLADLRRSADRNAVAAPKPPLADIVETDHAETAARGQIDRVERGDERDEIGGNVREMDDAARMRDEVVVEGIDSKQRDQSRCCHERNDEGFADSKAMVRVFARLDVPNDAHDGYDRAPRVC